MLTCFLQIVNAFFKSVMTKLLEASTSEQTSSQTQQQAQQYKRHTMMDLSLAMIPQLDEANWIILTRAIFPLLQVSNFFFYCFFFNHAQQRCVARMRTQLWRKRPTDASTRCASCMALP